MIDNTALHDSDELLMLHFYYSDIRNMNSIQASIKWQQDTYVRGGSADGTSRSIGRGEIGGATGISAATGARRREAIGGSSATLASGVLRGEYIRRGAGCRGGGVGAGVVTSGLYSRTSLGQMVLTSIGRSVNVQWHRDLTERCAFLSITVNFIIWQFLPIWSASTLKFLLLFHLLPPFPTILFLLFLLLFLPLILLLLLLLRHLFLRWGYGCVEGWGPTGPTPFTPLTLLMDRPG